MMVKDDYYLFELQEEFINSLELLHFDETASIVKVIEPPTSTITLDEQHITQVTNSTECSTCRLSFDPAISHNERVSHYKTDLHRLNLKRSLQDIPPLTEQQFEELLETQSVESISGSEDSDSDSEAHDQKLSAVFEDLSVNASETSEHYSSHMNTNSPFVLLSSSTLDDQKCFGAYKAIFKGEVLKSGAIISAIKDFNNEESRVGLSVILMIGGGHFAGAVVSHRRSQENKSTKHRGENALLQSVVTLKSKTFHRYTTRRKQGGSQSASDNARGKANSAGSSIRRYNEQALKKDVQDLLHSWRSYLSEANHIFIRAGGASGRKTLVGYDGAPLRNDDPRIKNIPFTTKRATLNEVKSAWTKLAYLSVLDVPKVNKRTEAQPKEGPKTSKPKPKPTPEVEFDQHTKEIVGLLKKSKAPLLINYMKTHSLDANYHFRPEEQFLTTPTPLHYASSQGLHHMVKILITNMNADPTIQNRAKKTPYEIASSKQVRNTFQVCRQSLGESYCDWKLARVGPPKTAEEIALEEAGEKKTIQEEKKKLIEEELAKKTELELRKPTFSSGGKVGGSSANSLISEMSGLSEQQRMRIMREQRARAAEARMRK